MRFIKYFSLISIICFIYYFENKNILNQINILSDNLTKYHYSEMESINSNMECILDLKGEE